MATAEQYADWIVNNQDKKGSPEFETIAQAYKSVRGQTQQSELTAAERVGTGVVDPIHGGAQLLTKLLPEGVVKFGDSFNNWLADKTGLVGKLPPGGVDQQVRERESAYQDRRTAAGQDGVDWWRIGGNVVSPVNLAMGAGAPAAATLGARIATGAALGAGSSALTPAASEETFATEKAKQLLFGGLGGAAAPIAAAGLGRIISPKASINPDLELLKASKVQPTMGQALGGRLNALEEKATSIPILGDAISNARARALRQFNEAAINRATAPIGVKSTGAGQDAVAGASGALSDAYETGKQALGFFTIDKQGAKELATLKSMANTLPTKERASFNSVWNYLQHEVTPNGSITADSFKRIDSKIAKEASNFSGSQDAYQKKVGDALKELRRVITESAKRANPDAADALKKADTGWANLVRVEGAAKAAKNSDGVFTPAQLNMAVQQADRSARKANVAHGDALMQDLANAGQNVLGNKVPNSFTADRALLAGGAGLGYMLDPMIPASLLGGAAAYSPWGQYLLRGAVSSRPDSAKTIAGLLNQSSTMLGTGGGLLALDFLK
jgi:hypothetical protein